MHKPRPSWLIAQSLLCLLLGTSAQASAPNPIQAIRANYALVNAQIAAQAYHTQRKDGDVCGDISSGYTRWTDTRGVTRKLHADFYNDSLAMLDAAHFDIWFDAHAQPNFVLYRKGRAQEPEVQVRFYIQRGRLIRVLKPSSLSQGDQQEIWRQVKWLSQLPWAQQGKGC